LQSIGRRSFRPTQWKVPQSGVNLSQDVPPFCWDVPPEIENVGRPSHPPSKVRDGGWGVYWASLSSSYGSCFKYLYE
jgi:hypothetical protein